jgi:hypothetical protein
MKPLLFFLVAFWVLSGLVCLVLTVGCICSGGGETSVAAGTGATGIDPAS